MMGYNCSGFVEQIRRAARRRRALATVQNSGHSNLTNLLLTLVFVFFICNVLSASTSWVLILKGMEPEVIEILTCLPIIINSSVNFILYYLMGSKFNKEFKLVLSSAFNLACKKYNYFNLKPKVGRDQTGETSC